MTSVRTILTQQEKKWIRSLSLAKFRKKENLFVAEGPKLVGEMLEAFSAVLVVGSSEWVEPLVERFTKGIDEAVILSEKEFERIGISSLMNPRPLLAVFRIPQVAPSVGVGSKIVWLDGVQDPGNVGAIIRCCDWLGIDEVWLSPQCADLYSPRVVQATMGALAHLPITRWKDEHEMIVALPQGVPLWGAFLEGMPYDEVPLEELRKKGFVLVLGNEGNGISERMASVIPHRVTIPARRRGACESLNVSTAASILIAHFTR